MHGGEIKEDLEKNAHTIKLYRYGIRFGCTKLFTYTALCNVNKCSPFIPNYSIPRQPREIGCVKGVLESHFGK